MLDDWAAIDPTELVPDLLAAMRALAFDMRRVIDAEWERRDLSAGAVTADRPVAWEGGTRDDGSGC